MSPEFPSIWVELMREKQKNLLLCGYYREWASLGGPPSERSASAQKMRLQCLLSQVERAREEAKAVVMAGDMNVDRNKWTNSSYSLHHLASQIDTTLNQLDLQHVPFSSPHED